MGLRFNHAMICGSARKTNMSQKLTAKKNASTNWLTCARI